MAQLRTSARTVGEVAELLTSELATNAVMHARTTFTVTVTSARRAVRIAVRDGSVRLPRVRSPGPYELDGRGMTLVANLAPRWGVDPVRGGKVVWFELDL